MTPSPDDLIARLNARADWCVRLDPYQQNQPTEQLLREAAEALAAASRPPQDRIRELEKLAYLGDHHFPDLTYKSRYEELVIHTRKVEAELVSLRTSTPPAAPPPWQPIETAPEATWVLVSVPNDGVHIATMTRDPNILGENGKFWFARGDDLRCWPTLWTPLPLPSPPAIAPQPAEDPKGWQAIVDFHREMARRFAEDRDLLKHRCRELETELAALRAPAIAPAPQEEQP